MRKRGSVKRAQRGKGEPGTLSIIEENKQGAALSRTTIF
jgi:hypothetical protein